MSRLFTSVNFVEMKALKMNLRRKSADGFAIPTHFGHNWPTYEGLFQSPTRCYSKANKAIGYKVNKVYRIDYLIRQRLSESLTHDGVQKINDLVNRREDVLATEVQDINHSLLLYLCWTHLKNFCPLTGRRKTEELIYPVDNFLDRFDAVEPTGLLQLIQMEYGQLIPDDIIAELATAIEPFFSYSIFELLPIFNPSSQLFNVEPSFKPNLVKALFLKKLRNKEGVLAEKNLENFLKNPAIPLSFKHRHVQLLSWVLTLGQDDPPSRRLGFLNKIYSNSLSGDLSQLPLADMIHVSHQVELYDSEIYFSGGEELEEQTNIYYQSCTETCSGLRRDSFATFMEQKSNINSIPRGHQDYETVLNEEIKSFQEKAKLQGLSQLEISYKTLKLILKPPETSFRRWVAKSSVRRKLLKSEQKKMKEYCFTESIKKDILMIFIEDLKYHHKASYHLSFVADFVSELCGELIENEEFVTELISILSEESSSPLENVNRIKLTQVIQTYFPDVFTKDHLQEMFTENLPFPIYLVPADR